MSKVSSLPFLIDIHCGMVQPELRRRSADWMEGWDWIRLIKMRRGTAAMGKGRRSFDVGNDQKLGQYVEITMKLARVGND